MQKEMNFQVAERLAGNLKSHLRVPESNRLKGCVLRFPLHDILDRRHSADNGKVREGHWEGRLWRTDGAEAVGPLCEAVPCGTQPPCVCPECSSSGEDVQGAGAGAVDQAPGWSRRLVWRDCQCGAQEEGGGLYFPSLLLT